MILYTINAVYAVAGIYFLLLFAAFLVSFRRKKENEKEQSAGAKPSLSVVILVNGAESYKEENLRKILEQDSRDPGKAEFIFIDRTGNPELLKELGYDYPNVKKMQFSTPQINLNIVREILALKASGEIFLFVDSRNRIPDNWISSMLNNLDEDTEILAGKRLADTEASSEGYFQAIDRLFKTVLQRELGPHGFSAYVTFDNMIVRRATLLDRKKIRAAGKKVIGNDPQTTVFCSCSPGLRALIREKLTENFWNNPLIDRSAFNIAWYILNHTMTILPFLLLLAYFRGLTDLIPLVILLFIKFLGEGFIISRGARIYSQQNLLNDFWTWFFMNPPLSFLSFIVSIFLPHRFFNPKQVK